MLLHGVVLNYLSTGTTLPLAYLFKLQIGFYPVAVVLQLIRHNTQNNTPRSNRNTAHKTTQTIKGTLYTMNTMQSQLQLQLNKVILITMNILYTKH
jgi:hypothetical protein